MRQLSLLVIMMVLMSLFTYAEPSGAQILSNTTETKTPASAQNLNTSGGSFTTVILSAESQNMKWKAYAGNVTGVLTLDDSGNYSIYQWQMSRFSGEVYSSRNSSIQWPNIRCATDNEIYSEETRMNHTTSHDDSINKTFSLRLHKSFFVATIPIGESTCRSTFTWANDTAQTPDITKPFQETILSDGDGIIFSTFIDDNTRGFNYKSYDFQMILPEKGVGGYDSTRYYFYLEIE